MHTPAAKTIPEFDDEEDVRISLERRLKRDGHAVQTAASQDEALATIEATDVPFDVDMIDVFRQSDAVPGIVDDALVRWPDLQTIWMQLGVEHAAAAAKARARGVTVIQNRCPAIEYPRVMANFG